MLLLRFLINKSTNTAGTSVFFELAEHDLVKNFDKSFRAIGALRSGKQHAVRFYFSLC